MRGSGPAVEVLLDDAAERLRRGGERVLFRRNEALGVHRSQRGFNPRGSAAQKNTSAGVLYALLTAALL